MIGEKWIPYYCYFIFLFYKVLVYYIKHTREVKFGDNKIR